MCDCKGRPFIVAGGGMWSWRQIQRVLSVGRDVQLCVSDISLSGASEFLFQSKIMRCCVSSVTRHCTACDVIYRRTEQNTDSLLVSQSLWASAVVSWGKSRPWRRSRAAQRPRTSFCVQSPESWWRIQSLLQVRGQTLYKPVQCLKPFFFHIHYHLSKCAYAPQMGIPMSENPSRAGSGARTKPAPWRTCPCRPRSSPPTDLWRWQ